MVVKKHIEKKSIEEKLVNYKFNTSAKYKGLYKRINL